MKKLVTFFSLLILAVAAGLWFLGMNSHPIPIPLTILSNYHPIVDVDIRGHKVPLEFDITSKYSLLIQPACLKNAHVLPLGEVDWKTLSGEPGSSPSFVLPAVKLGPHKFIDVVGIETQEVGEGSVGAIKWPLDQQNLVLDLPHHRIWSIHKGGSLEGTGLDLNKMTQISFESLEYGMRIPVTTNLGNLNLGMGTRLAANLIHSSIASSATEIAVQGFESQLFHSYPFLTDLGLDGFLGLDFLYEHIVYIDGVNKRLYIGGAHGNAITPNKQKALPITFTESNLPTLEVEIQRKKYRMMLDLGADSEFLCPPAPHMAKGLTPLTTMTCTNVWGESTNTQSYWLPECKIGGLRVRNLTIIIGDDLRRSTDIVCESIGTLNSAHGIMGYPILYRTNLFFDFKNRQVVVANKIEDLNLDLTTFEKSSFKITKAGIVVSIETGLGSLDFLVDTGASITAIRSYPDLEDLLETDHLGNRCFLSNTFKLFGNDYPPQPLHPLDLSPEWEYDGVLGMDFLREHAFYIDFPNRVIYLEKPFREGLSLSLGSE